MILRPSRAGKVARASQSRDGLRTRLGSEAGMVTAELALTFPAVILVLVSLALTGAAGMAQVQVSASARAACRAVAIGEDTGAAVAAGERLLGRGGVVGVSSGGKDVSCSASRDLPAMLGLLGMKAHSEAVIPREDSW
ncbi:MAG: pilus assembly protein [Mobiluncus sp.]|uniref:TadE family type IV pilus minor pilin n=1 Tax=Mobiluncus sp. TaxID=47293 RepID=UPI002583D3FE|nr:TadE family type IV pilus minor pilin [Mobiluncus sp.]MCI6583503.1 pilus assembly protein [Mobiluncus sp.]